MGIGAGLLAFGVVASQVGPLSQLCLLLVVPGLLYVLTYPDTRLQPDYSRRMHHWVVGLVNSDDRRPLDNLLRKGFLLFSGHGRLGLSSTSLRDYLLTA